MRTKALFLLLVLVALAAPANAGDKLRIKGKGINDFGLRFAFVVKGEHGPNRVEFETPSFGTITGEIDCYDGVEGIVIMSGVIDVPVSGLTHFRVIAFDGKPSDAPDREGSSLSSSPLACGIDEVDLNNAPAVIRRGNIVVRLPAGL
jgi:hypothetical protein